MITESEYDTFRETMNIANAIRKTSENDCGVKRVPCSGGYYEVASHSYGQYYSFEYFQVDAITQIAESKYKFCFEEASYDASEGQIWLDGLQVRNL